VVTQKAGAVRTHAEGSCRQLNSPLVLPIGMLGPTIGHSDGARQPLVSDTMRPTQIFSLLISLNYFVTGTKS
jgi:hypothetical protein